MSQKSKKKQFQVAIEKDKCKGCGLCIHFCPVEFLVFSSGLNKNGVRYVAAEKEKSCLGCGNCFLICPDACIEIYTKK